ncbi:hypothetical protein OSB04_029259 [Centaurea solstitialis]|uniref:Reverse transcriptase domain-containing protein n=1 Tax=Centaurea solstitialis TaxID=347529 RepID=A0AA38T225_9ASTR|nr:hypothetical protein OSB04_029259 [Centaurea solstitialis]
MELGMQEQVIHCQIRVKTSGTVFLASFVYGSNNITTRRILWDDLKRFHSVAFIQPWILMGDFNSVLLHEESLGGSSRRDSRMEEFVECVEALNVFDLRSVGCFFTWAQKPMAVGGILRKLDRVMVNSLFVDSFLLSSANFLTRGISDHSACVITIDQCQTKARSFKFDTCLIRQPVFLDVVKRGWSLHVHGTYMYRVLQKLKMLKQPLRILRSKVGSVSARVKERRKDVDLAQAKVDVNPTDLLLQDDLSLSLRNLQEALVVEDSYFRQRAKVRWIKEGDLNTSFFHNSVKEQKNRSLIRSVIDNVGVEVHGLSVGKAFVDHFQSILGMRDMDVRSNIPIDFFPNRISIHDANFMIRPITKEEVKHAMFDIGDDRSPGSDGFTASFFKAAWPVIGPDVELAIQDFFYRGNLARQVNHTSICLLPKHANASKVTDFRPISLCSVLYKCIAKIISWRIKDSLDFLVSPNQSAFIPGRKITDNILMANELVEVLNRMGFHPIMCNWIMELVTTVSFSILVNGELHGFFKGGRGLRQGCPLSPYLFTLVMEAFSTIFRRKVAADNRFAFHHGCEGISLTHLCFADYLMVFTRGDISSVAVLKEVLAEFGEISGLKPSIEKSAVYFSNVDSITRHGILQLLSFQVGALLFRYLGIPLSSKRLAVSDFAPLISKVRSRILNWKSKFLSFGGRVQLIKSVLESLQLYWMVIITFPASVIHSLEKLFRDFLWNQGDPSRGKVKVAWETVCKPKSAGGLGLKRLAMWNRALLASNIWDILRKKKSVWISWIYLHRLNGSNFWTFIPTNSSSWIWRKLVELREQFRPFFFNQLGNSVNTNAWEDKWIAIGPLSSFLPYRLMHGEGFHKGSNVAEVISGLNHAWPQAWTQRHPPLANVALPSLVNTSDQVLWLNSHHLPCRFSIKEVWRSLQGNWEVVPWYDFVWFKRHIPKHSFCLWLAILNRLPTQDRLLNWGLTLRLLCPFCNAIIDSRNHLFFECGFSASFWRLIRDEIGCNANEDWENIFHELTHRRSRPGELRKQLLFAGAVYFIWRERNNRLFKGIKREVAYLVKDLKLYIDIRCNASSFTLDHSFGNTSGTV